MSSPRKHEGRRVGFSVDSSGRPVTDAREGRWSAEAVAFARWVYLGTLARKQAAILADLATVTAPDEATGIAAWLDRWHLRSTDPADEWAAAYARGTLRLWNAHPAARGRAWADRDDDSGQWVDEAAPPVSRPLKHGQHFVWLIQRQLGRKWEDVDAAAKNPPDPKTVREAATALAGQIRLRMRPTRRGRQPKPAVPK